MAGGTLKSRWRCGRGGGVSAGGLPDALLRRMKHVERPVEAEVRVGGSFTGGLLDYR